MERFNVPKNRFYFYFLQASKNQARRNIIHLRISIVHFMYLCLVVSCSYVLSFTFQSLFLMYFTDDVVPLFTSQCYVYTFVAYMSSLDLCASSFLHCRTCQLWSPNLTLFVETKWAEWRDLFSHDGLRGKVLLCYAGLLSSIELRHLFYLLTQFFTLRPDLV